MKNKTLFAIACGFALAGGTLQAQILYSDNFDAGTSASGWTARLSHSDAFADFAFDYSTLGIPAAPGSAGTTIGMRFLVNQSAGVFQGISATPNGQSFTGDFRVSFDMWFNYVGPLGIGGSGTTQAGSFGWGVNGANAEWAGGSSGVLFAATLDGGSSVDYRVYLNNTTQLEASGVYAAGTHSGARNGSDPYYAVFGGEAAPAAQVALFPGQTGVTDAGETAFRWYKVNIDKLGDNIAWFIDGYLIASAPLTGVSLSGNNIVLGMFDTNAGSSTDPNDFLNAAIYDNIKVEVIPEPSSALLVLLGLGGLLFRRRA